MALRAIFLGRETYRRTEFIVLRAPDGRHAVIAVDAADREPLFAPIVHVEVLALPDSCVLRARSRKPTAPTGRRLPRLRRATASAKTGR